MEKLKNPTTEYQDAHNTLCDIIDNARKSNMSKQEVVYACVQKLMYFHSHSVLTQSESWDLVHQAYHYGTAGLREK